MINLKKFRFQIGAVLLICIVFAYNFISAEDTTGESDKVVQILYPYVAGQMNSSQKNGIGLKALEELVDAYNIVDANVYKIKLMRLDASSYSEYINKRNSLFFGDNQPDLIYITNFYEDGVYTTVDPNQFIDNGIAMEVDEQLKNFDHLYEWLKNPYYIPIGFRQISRPYLLDTLSDIGVDTLPKIIDENLKTEYMRQWILKREPKLEIQSYDQIIDAYFPETLFYDSETGLVEMDRKVILDRLSELKVYVEEGIIEVELLNNYEDTYFTVMNPTGRITEEIRNRVRGFDYYLLNYYSSYNLGNPMIRPNESITNSQYVIEPGLVQTTGFIFNRQGGDLEGALTFVDYCLSDRTQSIYAFDWTPAYNGMVTETTFDRELKKEWLKKGYVTGEGLTFWEDYMDFLRNGGSVMMGTNYSVMIEFYLEFKELIPKYLFSEYYTERALENDLRRLENAYRFRLLE